MPPPFTENYVQVDCETKTQTVSEKVRAPNTTWIQYASFHVKHVRNAAAVAAASYLISLMRETCSARARVFNAPEEVDVLKWA